MKKTYSSIISVNHYIFSFAIISLLFFQGCSKGGKTPTPVNPVNTIPTTANFSKLSAWNTYKTGQTSRYDLVMIGDSYIQGDYFTWKVRNDVLSDGFLDGGPGYCSFGRASTDFSIPDGSVEPTELSYTYDPTKWTVATDNAIGPCGNATNTAANSPITVTATMALNTITIIYERHAGEGDFRYRVNGGSWTTVSPALGAQDIPVIGSTDVDVSAAGSSIKLDIEPLAANEIFCGALARITGNVFNLHKVGSAGKTAAFFAQNALWSQSTALLTPKGIVIMTGINEMVNNVTPDAMKANVQNIIDKVKAIQPNVDIMIVCEPETKYDTVEPHTYKTADYGAMLYQLSLSNNAAFIYLPNLFGHFSQASIDNGLMFTDGVHPGDKGADLIATTIFSALKK